MRERTRQQVDPVGSGESRALWALLAADSGVYAVAMTVAGWSRTTEPWIAVAGAVLGVSAAVFVVVGTAPGRAPFTRSGHLAVHVVALAAVCATLWARHGVPFELGDAFGTIMSAGLIVAMSPYRPPAEIVSHGLTTAIIAGLAVLTAVLRDDAGVPPLVLVLTAIAPILVVSMGSAAYSETILRVLEQSRPRPEEASIDDAGEHRDRVAVMTQDAVPLLTRVLDRGAITERDRTDAQRTARALRTVLVGEANRTWLDSIRGEAGAPHFTVIDPDALARDLSATRRTVLRALLAALASEPGFTGGDVRLARTADHNTLTISARYDADDYTTPPGHPVVSALLDIMRSVFTPLESNRAQSRLLVTFRYEHH